MAAHYFLCPDSLVVGTAQILYVYFESVFSRPAHSKHGSLHFGISIDLGLLQIGFIGRLDYQKGPDLIQAGLPELMTDDVQFVSCIPRPSNLPRRFDPCVRLSIPVY